MNGVAEGLARRLVDRFAQSRMRVNCRLDFLIGCFEGHRQTQFRDHLRCLRSNDVRAKNFAVRLADDQFHEAFRFPDRAGFAAGAKGKFADPEFFSGFLGSALR